ncbi:glycine cleavage system protein GcvH [Treponema sp. OMZ 787]|uniref:glycine cleavage system protein GcvH n=1 Tax=Treponema sp. OMZ 787 TaxID=2563669 RepID=UPI0020A3318D|nr:glycine cleavage system protein GcvH [Treponema sp. OMZ 787]UTC61448.1 glycine cleavage system protein GcvH [Treponema sp. OMZ 787]
MEIKEDVKYLESHEWFKKEGNIGLIGISDYAQSEMGDVVFIELPEVGDEVTADKACATVESVKAVFEIISPMTGKVVEINEELLDAPEKINEDAFGSWFFKVELSAESSKLMDAGAYKGLCK